MSGLENGLLGLNSKVNAVVWAKNIVDVENMDIICFGHLLFEMCTGYELPSPRPTAGHLQLDLERYPQVYKIMLYNLHIFQLVEPMLYLKIENDIIAKFCYSKGG